MRKKKGQTEGKYEDSNKKEGADEGKQDVHEKEERDKLNKIEMRFLDTWNIYLDIRRRPQIIPEFPQYIKVRKIQNDQLPKAKNEIGVSVYIHIIMTEIHVSVIQAISKPWVDWLVHITTRG